MKVVNVQKRFVADISKEFKELNKSPIGIIDCPLNEFLSKINKFKSTAVPISYTHDEYISSGGEKVICSDYKDKNGVQLLWKKFLIFNPKEKLVREDFIDIVDKTVIKYNPSTGKMKSLEASSPKGMVKYTFA